VARWAGWGAGPSGAGAVGGPSKIFLVLALAVAIIAAVTLLRDGKGWEGGVAVAAAVYFLARLLGLGRRRES
jgi:hypothetical protein